MFLTHIASPHSCWAHTYINLFGTVFKRQHSKLHVLRPCQGLEVESIGLCRLLRWEHLVVQPKASRRVSGASSEVAPFVER